MIHGQTLRSYFAWHFYAGGIDPLSRRRLNTNPRPWEQALIGVRLCMR